MRFGVLKTSRCNILTTVPSAVLRWSLFLLSLSCFSGAAVNASHLADFQLPVANWEHGSCWQLDPMLPSGSDPRQTRPPRETNSWLSAMYVLPIAYLNKTLFKLPSEPQGVGQIFEADADECLQQLVILLFETVAGQWLY